MKIKIITCIYWGLYGTNFGGRESRKDHYMFSLLSLLKMSQADFVCYTSNNELTELKLFFYDLHKISESKLKFVVQNLSDVEYYGLVNTYKDVRGIKTSDRCYEIQYSKFSWFKNEDKSYDYYFWFDAGLSHTGIIPNRYLSGHGHRGYFESTLFNESFLNNLVNYCGDKFVFVGKENVRNYWEGTVDPKFYTNYDNSVHIIGGFFGGKLDLWDDIVKKFDTYLKIVLSHHKRLFYEEHIMSLLYQNHRELFKLLKFDIWWHEDNFKEGSKEFFDQNKSFYKMLEELNVIN